MNVVINYRNKNYHIFWLSKRNKEGGFTGNLNIPHTNKYVKTWHFTYPANGRFHYTIETKSKERILFFQDRIIVEKGGRKRVFKENEKKNVIKELAYKDLVPLGIESDKPTIFEILNLRTIFRIMNFHINTEALHLFPVFKKELKESDLLFDINTYKDENIVLEVFMSKEGESNMIGVECLIELNLDEYIPVIKARILRQKSMDQKV